MCYVYGDIYTHIDIKKKNNKYIFLAFIQDKRIFRNVKKPRDNTVYTKKKQLL